MGALKEFAIAAALSVAAPAHADQVDQWHPHIAEDSARFGIPQAWIERVMRAESGGRTMLQGRPITSRAGAMGLMQLMPGTWGEMRAALGLGADPHDPRGNILAGTHYLRLMYDRFGYPGLFAAYNAGPARYTEHLATGRALPGETIAYFGKVAPGQNAAMTSAPERPTGGLFFSLRTSPSPAHQLGERASSRLFVAIGGPSAAEQ